MYDVLTKIPAHMLIKNSRPWERKYVEVVSFGFPMTLLLKYVPINIDFNFI